MACMDMLRVYGVEGPSLRKRTLRGGFRGLDSPILRPDRAILVRWCGRTAARPVVDLPRRHSGEPGEGRLADIGAVEERGEVGL